jgi:hypothetical protein
MNNPFERVSAMRSSNPGGRRGQLGVATLTITLLLLVILTVIVLFSTNVGFFEQRTTTNENRAQITEQLAEYALNLSGEYLKANRANLVSDTGSGWFAGGAAQHWQPCPALSATPHPCDAERSSARRSQMYYYDDDPNTAGIQGLPYSTLAGAVTGALTGESSTSTTRFNAITTVDALLCRIDTSDATNPHCNSVPPEGRNVALVLVANVAIAGESSAATVKEAWATVASPMPSANVPLIASGLVQGLGNAQIVASPNAGGFGIAATIWSPNNVDIGNDSTGCGSGGVGSVSTCHLGEYLKTTPRDQLLTTCAGNGNSCGCPAVSSSGVDFLSGHSNLLKVERYDVLDADGNCGSPDITFFPSQHGGVAPKDDDTDPTDDSLFEYIFNVPYAVDENATVVNISDATHSCTSTVYPGQVNCAAYALTDEYGAIRLTDCSTLDTASSGIFYVTGNCDLHNIGDPTHTVIVVVDGDASVNGNFAFYGMLFVRSDNTATTAVRLSGTGNVKIFGSLVVEGSVDLHGNIDLVYQDTSATGGSYGPIPPNVRFAKVTGSWLDSQVGI